LDHWLASVILAGGNSDSCPWKKTEAMYKTIDSIKEGQAPWTTVQFRYTGPLPETPPKWMLETYELRFRDPHTILLNQMASPEFKDHFNYVPYMQFNQKGNRVWSNLMSGSWSWQEAVRMFALTFSYTHFVPG
jgi:Plavaka transposase